MHYNIITHDLSICSIDCKIHLCKVTRYSYSMSWSPRSLQPSLKQYNIEIERELVVMARVKGMAVASVPVIHSRKIQLGKVPKGYSSSNLLEYKRWRFGGRSADRHVNPLATPTCHCPHLLTPVFAIVGFSEQFCHNLNNKYHKQSIDDKVLSVRLEQINNRLVDQLSIFFSGIYTMHLGQFTLMHSI